MSLIFPKNTETKETRIINEISNIHICINFYHDPSLLPTLQCVGHAQKCITGTQTFPISKLGGWKHTTAFHKLFKTNRHQVLKHLRQYWCYGQWSISGNRRGRRTFRNRGDVGLSPASREITKTNKPQKTLN